MKKFLLKTFLLLLALVAGTSSSWADSETITFADEGLTNGEQYTDPFGTNINVTFGGGGNDGKYYTTGSGMRTYGGGTITITAKGNTVTNVACTFSGGSYAPADASIWTSNGTGTGTTGTTASWSGSATEVVMTRPSGSGHWRLQAITVTYTTGGGGTPTCETPTFSPVGGLYTSAQNVTLATETEGATIYYTTNGSDPTTESTQYTSAIAVSTTTTIKAIAVKAGNNNSSVASATYAIVEHAGTEADPYTIDDARKVIDYGTDSDKTGVYVTGIISQVDSYNPTYQSITYWISNDGTTTNQFEVYGGLGIDGAGFSGVTDLAVGDVVVVKGDIKKYNSTYEFAQDNELVSITHKVATPTFSPVAGAVASGTEITINCATDGATIYYTIDGTEPTTGSATYSTPIEITAATTIKAFAVKAGSTNSDVATAAYTIAAPCATPTFSEPEGEVAKGTTVTISCATDGATIYYTTDGTTPTTSSSVYSSAITVNATQTIKAIAAKDGYANSAVATAAYTVANYTTLPFEWDGGAKAGIIATTGVTTHGLGSDYAESNAPYRIKFDTDGDYIQVESNAQPGKVYVGVKMLGGNSTSTITVQGSADGTNFTNIENLTISGNTNDILNLATTQTFASTDRYVRLLFTKGSNVGVGPIKITGCKAVTISGSAGFATYADHDDDLDFSGVTGLKAFTASVSETTVTFTSAGEVPAGTGLLLKAAAGTYNVPVADGAAAVSENLLVAPTSKVTGLAYDDGANYNYILAQPAGKTVGFYRANNSNVAVGKAYLQISKSAGVKEFTSIALDDEETAISGVEANVAKANEIYNLAGQRVAKAQKGLYIVNGRKVVIK